MEKIGFLVADERMKKDIEITLQTFMSQSDDAHLPIDIVIIHFENIIAQAAGLIQNGSRVIITNSGSYQILSRRFPEFPFLCLYSSTSDILYTLNYVAKKYKKIHLLLNKHFLFNIDHCPQSLRTRLILHPSYSVDLEYTELIKILEKIPITADTAVVGCTLLPQITHLPMPVYSIRPNESTILAVYQYANELIASKQKDEKQISTLASILSHVDEGIILYDQSGHISHINEQACRFLKIPKTVQSIDTVFSDMSSGIPKDFKETILHRPPYTLVANSSQFWINKNPHYILTIRDVTELQRLENNVRYKLSKTGMHASHHFEDIKTKDPSMKELIATAKIMAACDAPVLIEGESGTGKELFAQSIHNASSRRNGPFVAVNCAALPPDLLESELFGYVGGAFTGARKEGKAGLFELAHTGTMFLDEINSMSTNIQSKLLRVLESKEVMRIGSDYIIPLDIRIISAGNTDLITEIQDGHFRRDLYFRLNTLILDLPTLDSRKKDILYLFSLFLEQVSGKKSTPTALPPALQNALEQHHWWGNIRELSSVAMRYHIFGDKKDSSYAYLFDMPDTKKTPAHLVDTASFSINMKQAQHTFQQLVINDLLAQGYSKTEVAQMLHITRQTLFNRLK